MRHVPAKPRLSDRAVKAAAPIKATALAVLALWASGNTAAAAVRVCKAPVASGLVSDTSELSARRGAIAAWTAKAKAAGVANPAWRLAGNKIVRCARVASGRFDCLAVGAPCTISQVAPSPAPPRPSVPGAPPAPGVKPPQKAPDNAPISI